MEKKTQTTILAGGGGEKKGGWGGDGKNIKKKKLGATLSQGGGTEYEGQIQMDRLGRGGRKKKKNNGGVGGENQKKNENYQKKNGLHVSEKQPQKKIKSTNHKVTQTKHRDIIHPNKEKSNSKRKNKTQQ